MALYHLTKGSVDYTIVGSPTIENGIASGFSDSNYLQLDSSFAPTSTWEISTKILIATIGMWYFIGGNGHNIVIGTTREGNKYYLKAFFSSNNSTWNIGSITGGEQLQSNTIKFVKFGFDGTKYYLESSDDGVTVNDRKELSSTASIVSSILTIGKGFSTNQYFTGSLDLNNTLITVDGQPWFGSAPIEVKSHQIKGQVGYTVVGSPTITDGVASDLSNGTNYLQLTAQPPSVINSFEFVCRCNCGSSTRGTFAYSYPTGYYRYGGFYCRTATRESYSTPPFWRYKAQQTSSEESHDLTCPANSGLANSSNDLVYSKLTMETVGENDYLYSFYQSLNGVTWTLLASKHDTYRMSGDDIGLITMTYNPNDAQGNTLYYARSIDLNNTYIKINGQLWFYQPRPTEYVVKDGYLVWANPKLYLTGPVNYEVVGSPTISDGVASGFSDSDYVKTTSVFNSIDTFEIYLRVLNPDTFRERGICGFHTYSGNFGFVAESDGTFMFRLATHIPGQSGPTEYVSIMSNVSAQTSSYSRLYAKVDTINRTIYFKQMLDDGTVRYTGTKSIPDKTIIYGSMYELGLNQWGVFTGGIDLNQSYIKIDNQLWFYGKNYATQNIAPVPANYTYGNTTTNAIGYVDMRTQAFHEAPAGTTIEKES